MIKILIVENVNQKFKNTDRYILQNVNLTIKDGEFVCLIGASGCGKSTLLSIIAGLIKPSSGRILLNNKIIDEPTPKITFMFQESALFPWLNVIDNVKFGMNIANINKSEQEEKALYYLNMVKLLPFKDYHIHQISGGMKQRVSLARALTLDSEVLLMDEPFAALDKQTKNILSEQLEDIWIKTKKTIVFVTHSVEEAIFHGDRIVLMPTISTEDKKIYNIDFKRPRKLEDEDFVNMRKFLLKEIRNEVEKSAPKEYDKSI